VLPRITAVVVAYGDEPLLEPCVKSLLASSGATVDVVVVDNGCTDGGVDAVRRLAGVTVAGSGENVGFAAGCNEGVEASSGDIVALVNPDAVAEPDALAALAAVVRDRTVGIATASLRLHDQADAMNSAGNEVHFLGYSWCGGLGRPAADYTQRRDVACASGAAMALTRATWNRLGGFAPEYFAYYEDSELSLRCWQQGLRVVFVPEAIVTHRYAFRREPRKLYLVERNRLIALATLYDARTLAVLAPLLLAMEIAMLGAAVARGWARAKVGGWWWIVRHRRWIAERRARLQGQRVRSDRELAGLFATRIADGNDPIPRVLEPIDRVLAAYWRAVARRLR
jgi:GT2 family glycosyltransferase